MMLFSVILSMLAWLLPPCPADTLAQEHAPVFARPLSEAEILCIEAEDQRASCEFSAALESYRKALGYPADSLRRASIDSLMTLCRNGAAMSQFCHRPKVAARQLAGISEFLDYYPFTAAQKSRMAGSAVDTLMLVDSTRIAAFFPIENEDYIYFSSRELFGMGGSDLYRCRRIGETPFVSEPENLGFPYSSPADDFLMLHTADGKFTLFASTRGCEADSVWVYAIVREAVPVRVKVEEGAPLRALCELSPASEAPSSPEAKKALSAWRKADKANTVLQDSLSRHTRELDALRRRYVSASGGEKQLLASEITRMETALPSLRRKASASAARLDEAEAECRRQGVDPSPEMPALTLPFPPKGGLTRAEKQLISSSDSLMHVLTVAVPAENGVLRSRSVDFTDADLKSPEFKALAAKMKHTVQHPSKDGVGIAAPQVGLSRRLIVVCRLDLPGEPFIAYANPYIDSLRGETVSGREGCLSIPGLRGNVPRAESAIIRYKDPATLQVRTETVSGYVARIFQHEIDHLEGILYTDRTSDTWTVNE